MPTIRFIIEIEDVDDKDFNITDREAKSILSDFEEIIDKRGYSLYDSNFERVE